MKIIDPQFFVSHAKQESEKAATLKHALSARWASLASNSASPLRIHTYTSEDVSASDLRTLWKTLRASGVLIAIIENNFLNSPTCIEELVRADEAGVERWAITCEGANPGRFVRLLGSDFLFPWNARSSTWQACCDEFAETLFNRYGNEPAFISETKEKATLREDLFDPATGIFSSGFFSLPPQKRMAAIQVVKSAVRNAVDIVRSNDYSLDLSASSAFLEWAVSHFSKAESVAAVSREDISEFWVRKENRDLVGRYISGQCRRTMRLFVFDTPQKSNYYRNILDLSDDSYGQDGSVMVCSRQAYSAFLSQLPSLQADCAHADFGVLNIQHVENRPALPMYARLERHMLTFQAPSDSIRSDLGRFSNALQAFKGNTDGWRTGDAAREDHSGGRGLINIGGSELRVMRWKKGCGEDAAEWAESLEWLFGSELTGELKHVVFFSISAAQRDHFNPLRPEDFERDLLDVKEDHYAACKEEGISLREVWVGRRCHPKVFDERTNGRLNTNRDGGVFQYALAATFETVEDLERWYQSRRHSGFRERLYCRLDRRVAALYGDLEHVKQSFSAEAIWTQIENRVSESIARFDWTILEDFRLIAQRPPYNF